MVTASPVSRRRSTLEQLVDRLLASLLSEASDEADRHARRDIHESRRMRKAGAMDDALAHLSALDFSSVSPGVASWAYAEWLTTVRRRSGVTPPLLYRAGPGKAAVLEPGPDDDTVRVVAVLGLRWEVGKTLSRRCLRGLVPLGSSGVLAGGAPCPRS